MTRYDEAAQNSMNMSIMVALCIASYLEQSGIHEFSKDELKQFMLETSSDIDLWLKGESEVRND